MTRAEWIVEGIKAFAEIVETIITARDGEDVVTQLRALGAARRADLSSVERERLRELEVGD